MCKALLPLKLLVETNDWPFLGKTKFIFYMLVQAHLHNANKNTNMYAAIQVILE